MTREAKNQKNERVRNRILKLSSLAVLPLLVAGISFAQSKKNSQTKAGNCKPTGDNCYVETFSAPVVVSGSMDYLFVVETSDSIKPELPTVRAGISKFVDALPQGADFNVAVMLSHGSTSALSGKLYRADSEPAVLRSRFLSKAEMKNYIERKLSKLIQDPQAGGGEEGLFSLFNGIANQTLLAESKSQNFFRDSAGLGVVFVADQRDICAITPPGVPAETNPAEIEARIRDCEGLTVQGLTSRLKQLKGSQPLRVSGIVYSKPPVPVDGENELSYGYLELIQMNGGQAVDIVQDNIAQGLQSVTVGGGSTLAEFTLSHTNVDPSSVKVTVNGQNISFQVIGNKVILTQMIPSGSEVIIHYCLRSVGLSSKAEKLAAIMTMSCPIPNKSYPKDYVAPSAAEIAQRLRACTPQLYPETPTSKKQQVTLDRLLNPQDGKLRHHMFHSLWYRPVNSDHFEYYFGLGIDEAVQIFCLNNPHLSDTLITSEYAKSLYDQEESWRNNPAEQKKWRFAQSIRKQLLSCLNR